MSLPSKILQQTVTLQNTNLTSVLGPKKIQSQSLLVVNQLVVL